MRLPFRMLLVGLLSPVAVAPARAEKPAAAAPPVVAPVAPVAGPVPLVLRDGPRPIRDAGIGASLAPSKEGVLLERLAPGMGADTAGLKPGDEILAVDGKPTAGKEIAEVASWIRGERDTSVLLQVRRPGSDAKAVTITRMSLKDPRMKKLVAEMRAADAAKPPEAAPSKAPVVPERVDPTGRLAPVLTVDRWVNTPPTLGKTLEGRVLLIDFWATWCGPCRRTLPVLADLARELGPQGLTIVGLSIDEEVGAVESFLAENPLPYPVGWTVASELDRYGRSGIPTLVLVGSDGRVRFVHEGGLLPVAAIREAVAALKPVAP